MEQFPEFKQEKKDRLHKLKSRHGWPEFAISKACFWVYWPLSECDDCSHWAA